jgi:hypothetical protein
MFGGFNVMSTDIWSTDIWLTDIWLTYIWLTYIWLTYIWSKQCLVDFKFGQQTFGKHTVQLTQCLSNRHLVNTRLGQPNIWSTHPLPHNLCWTKFKLDKHFSAITRGAQLVGLILKENSFKVIESDLK